MHEAMTLNPFTGFQQCFINVLSPASFTILTGSQLVYESAFLVLLLSSLEWTPNLPRRNQDEGLPGSLKASDWRIIVPWPEVTPLRTSTFR